MSYKETPEPGQAPKVTEQRIEPKDNAKHLPTIATLLEQVGRSLKDGEDVVLWSLEINIDPDV
jgi:hypothetical protein